MWLGREQPVAPGRNGDGVLPCAYRVCALAAATPARPDLMVFAINSHLLQFSQLLLLEYGQPGLCCGASGIPYPRMPTAAGLK